MADERDSFINIQSFMTKKLRLSGNELIVYALIHGFSQDGNSYFYGSLKYIMENANVSKQTALSVLQSLVKKGLVVKKDVKSYSVFDKQKKALGGQHFCLYYTAASRNSDSLPGQESLPGKNAGSRNLTRSGQETGLGGSRNLTRSGQEFRPNNKFDNKADIPTDTSTGSLSEKNEQPKKPKQQKAEGLIVQELRSLFGGHFVFDDGFVPAIESLCEEFGVSSADSDALEYLRYVFEKASEKKPASLTNMYYKMAKSPAVMQDFVLSKKEKTKQNVNILRPCPVCGAEASIYESCPNCGFNMDDRKDERKVALHKQVAALPEATRNDLESDFRKLFSNQSQFLRLDANCINPDWANEFKKKVAEIYSKYGIYEKGA